MRWLLSGCLLVLLVAASLGAQDRVLRGGRYFDTERGELVPNPGIVSCQLLSVHVIEGDGLPMPLPIAGKLGRRIGRHWRIFSQSLDGEPL